MAAIGRKMQDMREGERDFYTYKFLASRGFLPNYGFGGSTMFLALSDSEDDIVRDKVIAISEFAPGNTVYYKGSKYLVSYARPQIKNQKPVRTAILVCPNCSIVLRGRYGYHGRGLPEVQYSLHRDTSKLEWIGNARHVRRQANSHHE